MLLGYVPMIVKCRRLFWKNINLSRHPSFSFLSLRRKANSRGFMNSTSLSRQSMNKSSLKLMHKFKIWRRNLRTNSGKWNMPKLRCNLRKSSWGPRSKDTSRWKPNMRRRKLKGFHMIRWRSCRNNWLKLLKRIWRKFRNCTNRKKRVGNRISYCNKSIRYCRNNIRRLCSSIRRNSNSIKNNWKTSRRD